MSIIESLYRNVIILKINNCNKKFVKAKNNVFGHILLVYFFFNNSESDPTFVRVAR